MFDFTREEQQQARVAKLVESLEQLTADLRMDEIVKPTTLVEIQNAARKTFEDWVRKVNTDGDGEKVYAYNAMRILQEVTGTWARLYELVATLRDEELGTFASLRKQLAECEKTQD